MIDSNSRANRIIRFVQWTYKKKVNNCPFCFWGRLKRESSCVACTFMRERGENRNTHHGARAPWCFCPGGEMVNRVCGPVTRASCPASTPLAHTADSLSLSYTIYTLYTAARAREAKESLCVYPSNRDRTPRAEKPPRPIHGRDWNLAGNRVLRHWYTPRDTHSTPPIRFWSPWNFYLMMKNFFYWWWWWEQTYHELVKSC